MTGAVAYFSHDFDFEEHRQSVASCFASGVEHDEPASGAAAVHDCDAGDGTAAAWDAFHRQHASAPFFKPRRYLLVEFPRLAVQGAPLTVLEVGCGSGSGALPVLLGNPDARVAACDFSPAAVMAAQEAACAAGIPSTRFVAFVADPSKLTPSALMGALNAAASAAGWEPIISVDAALLVFVLSAVPVARLGTFTGTVAACVRLGGALLVRDYGLYDLPMLRFAPCATVSGGQGRVFMRQDGTLARFFDREELAAAVSAGAAGASAPVACDAAEWCCVVVRNRATGEAMKRVFVHAVFSRVEGGA